MPEPRIRLVGGVLLVVALVLVCGASAASVPRVSGMVVWVSRGALEISSLSMQDQRHLTTPRGRHERRWEYGPTWSPDGSMIAFARWTPKQLSLMVVRSDGSGLRPVAGLGGWPKSRFSAGIYEISWSPDASQLAFGAWFPKGRFREAINVAAVDGSGSRPIAQLRKNADAFFSLFGWTPDGSRVTYAHSLGAPNAADYEGPSDLMTTSADGTDKAKILTEDEIDQASWLPDGSLLYVRHCYYGPCQLALREPGSGTSRPLTHFKDSSVYLWDYLPFMRRPSGEIVYTHGPKIYDFSPTTNMTRTVGAVWIPRKKHEICDAVSHWVALAGISRDGRVALIEAETSCDGPAPGNVRRDYRLDLETGALTRRRLLPWTSPAQIYLG